MKLPDPRKVEAYECPECGGLFLERDHAEACAELDRIEPGIEVIATDVAPLMRVRPETLRGVSLLGVTW